LKKPCAWPRTGWAVNFEAVHTMSRPGFYFFFCPDAGLVKRQIHKTLEPYDPDSWEINTLWSDDPELDQKLWKALNMANMMGPSRVVVVRNCQVFKDAQWKALAPALKGFKSGIWPFFCLEGQWDKQKPKIPAVLENKKFFKIARERGWIWQFPGITRQNLPRYLEKRARETGLVFAPGVQEKLVNILPLNSLGVDQELEKLLLLANDQGKVEAEHLDIVEPRADLDIFAQMQSIQQGKNITLVWQKFFRDQQTGQEALFPFLGLLLHEARVLWHLAAGEEDRVFLYPRTKNEKKRLARQLGPRNIARLWDMILEAEAGVKSGTILQDQALEKLTADLYQLFRQK